MSDRTEKAPPMKIISKIAGPFNSENRAAYVIIDNKNIEIAILNLYSLSFVSSYIFKSCL